ncbi:MAG: helix-turn-helix domain-containing protein [Nitrospirales bacterium]
MAGTVNVGEVIRRFREDQKLSVRTLASKCGFSPSFISQVENGQASPSINSLERIALALGITLGDFFQAREAPPPSVIRAGSRPTFQSQWSRARIEALGPVGRGEKLEPVMITLSLGGSSGKRPFARPTEQFAMVFDGKVVLTLDQEEHTLRRGDAVTIPSGVPHRWENPWPRAAKILIVSVNPVR